MRFFSLNQRSMKIVAIVSIYLSIISGRFSFDRLFSLLPLPGWIELRFCFAFTAAIACLFLWRGGRHYEWRFHPHAILCLAMLFVLYLYFVLNVIFLGDVSHLGLFLSDTLIVLVSSLLIMILFDSEADVFIFAYAAEALGILLFLLAVLGVGNPELHGSGWAPIGGGSTFSRITYLTFCCAIFLWGRKDTKYPYVHLLIAALGLYATFASLQKAALLGGLIVILTFLLWLSSIKAYRKAIVILVLTATVLLCYSQHSGPMMMARVNEALSYTSASTSEHWTVDILRKIQSGNVKSFSDLTIEQQKKISAYLTLSDVPDTVQEEIRKSESGGAENNLHLLTSHLANMSRTIPIVDRSDRIAIAFYAWELFKKDWLFGNGIGNFHYSSIHKYTKKIETYSYPHNLFLEIAATSGIIGLLIFSGILFITIVLIQQRLFCHANILFLFGYQMFVFITAMYFGDSYDFRLYWYLAFVILATYKVEKSPSSMLNMTLYRATEKNSTD